MRPPGYRFTGTFLSDLLAIGRDRVEIACAPCGRRGSASVASLIEHHGDVVLPHLLQLMVGACPRRGGVSNLSCSAVYAQPLTAEEEARIRAHQPS